MPSLVATRRPTRTFSRSKRSGTDWARIMDIAYTTVAANTKQLIATISLSNPGIGEVVRRTRVQLSISSDQSAAGEDQIGALGFIVVNDLAIAAGAAAIPGPVADANDDGWFVWMPFHGSRLEFGGAGGSGQAFVNIEQDSKAMRRVEEGFTIAVMLENASLTDGISYHHSFSMLTSRM